MLGRKKDKSSAATTESPLEQRVDAMMDPSLPDQPAAPPEAPDTPATSSTALPPLDIFNDPKTAPDVPKELLKQLGAAPAASQPADNARPAKQSLAEEVAPTPAEQPALDDDTTDAAVDDIVAHESDTVLAAEDAAQRPAAAPAGRQRQGRIGTLVRQWWFWLLAIVILLAVGAAVPYSRYRLAGLFITRQVTVTVTDSTTHSPVSDALVSLDGQQSRTDSAGLAQFHASVGNQEITVSKQYFRLYSQQVTIGLSGPTKLSLPLVATGRQVPLKVMNAISGQPLADATISVLGTTTRTAQNGQATIVLPAGDTALAATVSRAGFNSLKTNVQVTGQQVATNTFRLVPSGRVYFLSNASGKIDVVSTELDGSNRQTVLAGTGSEDSRTTILMASSDWHYLALLSKRSGGQYPRLYLIDTTNDQVTTIDDASDNFQPIGWSGHYFVYEATNPAANNWQPGGTLLKSYDADSGKDSTLVTSQATGTSNADAQYQNIWQTTLMDGRLVYVTTWYSYPGYLTVSGQQDSLNWVSPDGSDAKVLKSVDAGSSYISDFRLVTPAELDFSVSATNGNSTSYYRLDTNGNVTQSNTITASTMSQSYPNFLLSPSGSRQFWSEQRDGKQTLLIGDQSAGNPQTIASNSDLQPYGWYGNGYVLLTKQGSELYIMSADGQGAPLLISSYFSANPNQNFAG